MNEVATQRPWTGRLELAVTGKHGWSRGTIDMMLGIDTITVRTADRQVAVLVRDAFHSWLVNPAIPLECDDTQWFWSARTLRLSILSGTRTTVHCALTADALETLVNALVNALVHEV